MDTKATISMINLYFDGELEKGKEALMFSLLSQDVEAREFFKKINVLKAGMQNNMEEFPQNLEEKILHSVEASFEKQSSSFLYKKNVTTISYVAATVLLILTIFFYSESQQYKVQFNDLTRVVKKQNENLELLINALPQVEVEGSYFRTKQIIVRPNS